MQIDRNLLARHHQETPPSPEQMSEEEWLKDVKPGRYETPFWQFVAILGWAAATVLGVIIMVDRPIF